MQGQFWLFEGVVSTHVSRLPDVCAVIAGRNRRYMASHPQYADAAPYVGKFRALQQRAMGSIRTRVQSVLKQAVEQVCNSVAVTSAGLHLTLYAWASYLQDTRRRASLLAQTCNAFAAHVLQLPNRR